jgi:uncharacterized membrane protein
MQELLPNIITNKDIYLWLIATFIFLFLDFVFLFLNKSNFERQLLQVQRVSVIMKPTGILFCYLFLLFGLYYFILREKRTPLEAFLLGLIIYGVYETTTYSVLNNWKFTTVLTDTLWGGILFYLTTIISYKISNQFP